ncbi:hypothetical protein HA402_013815 [Bradysia odoriphaga]|nr:hypothetical protein HA402_013815 [Bradysia odoriphaga]
MYCLFPTSKGYGSADFSNHMLSGKLVPHSYTVAATTPNIDISLYEANASKFTKIFWLVLAKQCEQCLLMNAKKPLRECAIVDDIEPNIFQNMLQFIYAGVIPANLEDISVDLYKAADYYWIVKLIEICKEDIHFRLRVGKAIERFELATIYNIDDMRMDAWKIIKR